MEIKRADGEHNMKSVHRILLGVVAAAMLAAPCALADDDYEFIHDVIYGRKAGMALTFDVVKPRENANGIGVLCMMSGGWVSSWRPTHEMFGTSSRTGGRFATVVDQGFTLFLVWHGSSPVFKVPDAVDDVRRAVRYIRLNAEEFGVDPDKLGVFGASAGGHLALMLGTNADEGDPNAEDEVDRQSSRVAAVVAYFPPVDLRRIVGPNDDFPALDFDPEQAEAVSPIVHVTNDDAPALMIHGDKDRLVPVRNSEQIHQALTDAGVESEFIVIEGADHGFYGGHAQTAAQALTDWFEKHLVD